MVKRFTIDRSKWLNGEILRRKPGSYSALLNTALGKMCCLGFYAKACGLTDQDIADRTMPGEIDLDDKVLTELDWLIVSDNGDVLRQYGQSVSAACFDLTDANDSTHLDAPLREARIKELFAAQGIEVEFINSAAD